MREHPGSVTEISVFLSRILDKQAEKFCLMHTSAWLPGWKWGEFGSLDGIVSVCLHCIFHIISILFSSKSCQSYDRLESYNFVFHHFTLIPWILCQTCPHMYPRQIGPSISRPAWSTRLMKRGPLIICTLFFFVWQESYHLNQVLLSVCCNTPLSKGYKKWKGQEVLLTLVGGLCICRSFSFSPRCRHTHTISL